MRIYLAAPLFSHAETQFNVSLRDELNSLGHVIFLPQDDSNDTGDLRGDEKKQHIFRKNVEGIDNADLIVAVLDGGADMDSGTAWEIGYAYAKGMPILGLRTDFRTLGDEGTVNLMIEYCLRGLYRDVDELLDAVEEY